MEMNRLDSRLSVLSLHETLSRAGIEDLYVLRAQTEAQSMGSDPIEPRAYDQFAQIATCKVRICKLKGAE